MDNKGYYFQSGQRERARFDYDDERDRKSWWSSTYTKLAAASIAVLAVVLVINSIFSTGNSAQYASKASVKQALSKYYDAPEVTMQFAVLTPGYNELKCTAKLPWKHIVQPAREQIFQLKEFVVGGKTVTVDESVMSIDWVIDGASYSGAKASFTISSNKFGTLIDFSVTVSSKGGRPLVEGLDPTLSFTYKGTAAVKYVRREFRSLTQDDKTRFIKAIQAMYSLSDVEGQKKYGAKFHTAEYYLYKHLTGAGKTDCDHWHDGAGLVPHHTAFTLEVEQTLQAIDPSVAMPYWEYGMDAYLYTLLEDSPMFDQDFFGEKNPQNTEHRIADGSFWETVKMPDARKYADWSIPETGSLNPYMNAYGAMRSPWNNNPSPYIGRTNTTYGKSQYSAVPSCSVLQPCYQSDSLADMSYCLNGATHGPVHIMIGGAWGDDDRFSEYNIPYLKNADKILLFKILWRLGYTRCPDSCDVSDPDNCRCSVPQEYIDTYGVRKILEDSNIYYVFESKLATASEATMLKVLRLCEHPGVAGEMFTSAAPFDPTFWPLHGSMERMLGLRRLEKDAGTYTDFDETWGYPEYNKADGAAYLPGVCDWSNVQNSSDLTLPVCNTTASCSGHGEDDMLEFSNFLNKGETYSNIEFYEFLHPSNIELPYVYDTYDFDYCAEHGYDFYDFSASAAKKAKKQQQKQQSAQKLRHESKGHLVEETNEQPTSASAM